MSIYSGAVFAMKREQFNLVAGHVGIGENARDCLLYPKRAITVSIPLHTDD
ncbi:hypothetical protein ABIC09_007377 [Bradyrhizobium sp. S3.12.5]|uniref:hypothetical protein n=1 Tax=Bradyrhizobium sp. S3.12.5 TaxID=3156386 RepID=UPI003397332F